MNNKALVSTSVCIILGIFCTPQPSQALDLKKIFDPILKRGVCAAMGVNTGECTPEPQNSSGSTYPPSPNYPNPNYPQDPSINPNNNPYGYPQYQSPNSNQPYGYPQYQSPNSNQPYGYPQSNP